MSPQRIQLRRTKGWRKPEGAIVVARPSKWGNPWQVVHRYRNIWAVMGRGEWTAGVEGHDWTKADAQAYAVMRFRELHDGRSTFDRDAQIVLAGHDLACWCGLDQPCHADVLLEIANGVTP